MAKKAAAKKAAVKKVIKKLSKKERLQRTKKYPYGRRVDGSACDKPGRKGGKAWAPKKLAKKSAKKGRRR